MMSATIGHNQGPTLAEEVALIDRTWRVRKPNGEIVEVNRFDWNINTCCVAAARVLSEPSPTHYIQCSDSSWMRMDRLTLVDV